jgi:hypothetical protein
MIQGCNIFDLNDSKSGTLSPLEYELLIAKEIDKNGGSISIDQISIEIPQGAINEPTNIEIFEGIGDNNFLQYTNSKLYQLRGLPEYLENPIILKIECEKKMKGDPLIALGELMFTSDTDSMDFAYVAHDAEYVDNKLIIEYKGSLGKLKSMDMAASGTDNVINFIALNSYKKVMTEQGHFELCFPILYEKQAKNLGKSFENAFSICKDMGFKYPHRTWPVSVTLMSFASTNPGTYYYCLDQNTTDQQLISKINKGRFTINIKQLNDMDLMEVVAIHEFLHLVQNLYEFSSPYVVPEQVWLKEATSVWIQHKMVGEPGYVPSQLKNRYKHVSWGLNYSDLNISHTQMGYAFSCFIEDIAQIEGEKAIVEIFEEIQRGTLPANGVNPVDAVRAVIDRPLKNYLHGVLSSYVGGDFFGNEISSLLLNDRTTYLKLLTIDQKNNTHQLTADMFDLSGEIIKISPGDLTDIHDKPLVIKVDDPENCGLVAYQFKDRPSLLAESIPGGSGNISIENVGEIFQQGYEIVLLVTNGNANKGSVYRSYTPVKIDISLKQPLPEVVFADVTVRLDEAEAEYTWNSGGSGISKGFDFFMTSMYAGMSSFDGSVYQTIFEDSEWNNRIHNGYMNIRLSEDLQSVSLDVDLSSVQTDGVAYYQYNIHLDNVPFSSIGEDYPHEDHNYDIFRFIEKGPGLARIHFDHYYEQYGVITRRGLNTNCGENAEVEIYLWVKCN